MRATEQSSVFQLKANPLTGQTEWVVVVDNQEEEDVNSTRDVMAHTAYLDMLNDTERNRAYDRAIRKTIRGPCHVLDIGAGTGLLSMMSLRAMSETTSRSQDHPKEGLVTACEAYLPMVKLARKVLRLNGMEGRIRLIHKRSDELQIGSDLPYRADILVSEILDSELLGEGLIPTLQFAHDHLLIPDAQTIPYKATIYGQVVQSTFLWKLHDLHGNETLLSDGLFLAPVGSEEPLSFKRSQHAMHCDAITSHVQMLSEPFKVFDFDFWRRPKDYRDVDLVVKVTSDGKAHAIISWWVLQLDKEGTIFYSTAPKWIKSSYRNPEKPTEFYGGLQWCNHWKQCVWFIPGSGLSVSADEEIIVQAVHDAVRIHYDVWRKNVPTNQTHLRNTISGYLNVFVTPERIAVLGDKDWRSAMIAVGRQCLQGRSSPLCVVVDDSLPLTVIAASLSSSSRVISLLPGLGVNGLRYLERVVEKNGFSLEQIQVLGKKAKQLTVEDTEGEKVDILLAEPFYLANEGKLPWQNLRFWNERTLLAPLLSEKATILPCKGILRGCAMSLPDLWTSRRCLKDIEGFDHSVVNEIMGACGDLPDPLEGPILPYSIWQCGNFEELSEEFILMEFNFTEEIQKVSGKAMVPFSKFGLCHGIVLWMDWVMDPEESLVISTKPGPRPSHWKQGVKLLKNPIQVGNIDCNLEQEHSGGMPIVSAVFASSIMLEGLFDPSNGKLDIKLDFVNS